MLLRFARAAHPPQENLKKAEERDHRRLGRAQKLFLFHELSPGSAFWLPHGTVIYNTLVDFVKKQLWERDYTEVRSGAIMKENFECTFGVQRVSKKKICLRATYMHLEFVRTCTSLIFARMH